VTVFTIGMYFAYVNARVGLQNLKTACSVLHCFLEDCEYFGDRTK